MANELIFYKTPDGEQRIEVVYEDENFWMSQRALAELFAVGVPAINKH
ncbi:MAG: virulence protein, partial [Gammaproteobacteria bacterium]